MDRRRNADILVRSSMRNRQANGRGPAWAQRRSSPIRDCPPPPVTPFTSPTDGLPTGHAGQTETAMSSMVTRLYNARPNRTAAKEREVVVSGIALVELGGGATRFGVSAETRAEQAQGEAQAGRERFGTLPPAQAAQVQALRQEFGARKSPEGPVCPRPGRLAAHAAHLGCGRAWAPWGAGVLGDAPRLPRPDGGTAQDGRGGGCREICAAGGAHPSASGERSAKFRGGSDAPSVGRPGTPAPNPCRPGRRPSLARRGSLSSM